MSETPKDLRELFRFYYDYVKPLYAAVSAENVMPQEVLFEINAAFDHVSRHWEHGEPEADMVKQAYGHLKRSCLDIFKLSYKDLKMDYDRMMKADLSLIDNGDFEGNARRRFAEITQLVRDARNFEGKNSIGKEKNPEAFEKWLPAYEKGEAFRREYILNPKVDWAKKKTTSIFRKEIVVGIIINVAIGVLFFVIGAVFSEPVKAAWEKIFP